MAANGDGVPRGVLAVATLFDDRTAVGTRVVAAFGARDTDVMAGFALINGDPDPGAVGGGGGMALASAAAAAAAAAELFAARPWFGFGMVICFMLDGIVVVS